MGDVDTILQSGTHRGRRGASDLYVHVGKGMTTPVWVHLPSGRVLTPGEMRRLIVRDLHRAECPGLDSCGAHPVVTVAKGALGGWVAFPPHCDSGRAHATFAEAIAAVHNMTGDKA